MVLYYNVYNMHVCLFAHVVYAWSCRRGCLHITCKKCRCTTIVPIGSFAEIEIRFLLLFWLAGKFVAGSPPSISHPLPSRYLFLSHVLTTSVGVTQAYRLSGPVILPPETGNMCLDAGPGITYLNMTRTRSHFQS